MGFEEIQVKGQILQCYLYLTDDGNLTFASLSDSGGEGMLAQRKPIYLSRQALDLKNHT